MPIAELPTTELPLHRALAGVYFVARLDIQNGWAQRLKALGIFEGQQIQLSKCGDPMIVKAAGGKIAIAVDIAQQIVVRTDSE